MEDSRNPTGKLEYLAAVDESNRVRFMAWARSLGAAHDESGLIGDLDFNEAKREIHDAFLDATDRSVGIVCAASDTRWRVAQEPTPGFPGDLCAIYVKATEDMLSADGPEVTSDWADLRAGMMNDLDSLAFRAGATRASGALCGFANCLRMYSVELLLQGR